MALYGIGDLHLAKDIDKPMDVFSPYWENYMEKIETNWRSLVSDSDTVLIPGDVSWATYLSEIDKDFSLIESLPGKKIISRGNHDYWWTTVKKMETFTSEHGFNSITFLQNKAIEAEDAIISATRGWLLPGDSHFKQEDIKIYDREILRLELCLKDIRRLDPDHTRKRIMMLHYPPLTKASQETDFSVRIEENDIDLCVYGHLHGNGHRTAYEGEKNGTTYRCISSDFIGFKPLLLS